MRHRQAMAAWLESCGLIADPERIVLTAGAQHAMAVALAAVVKPGDTLLVEELTYSGARLLAQQMGWRLRGVAMDGEGVKPDSLESAIRATRARVLYCMPRLQNPTSAVMLDRRRKQIAAIADKHRLTVIEDDTYGFLSTEREPLAALLPERTIFITSLSKSLFPGLRLGCAVPPAALVEKVTSAVWATMINTSPIGADIMSSWIEDGTAARIADWKRHEVAARQQIIRRLLQGERLQTQPSSPHAGTPTRSPLTRERAASSSTPRTSSRSATCSRVRCGCASARRARAPASSRRSIVCWIRCATARRRRGWSSRTPVIV
jgi:DNA-binding transcriptional MocR family regulator